MVHLLFTIWLISQSFWHIDTLVCSLSPFGISYSLSSFWEMGHRQTHCNSDTVCILGYTVRCLLSLDLQSPTQSKLQYLLQCDNPQETEWLSQSPIHSGQCDRGKQSTHRDKHACSYQIQSNAGGFRNLGTFHLLRKSAYFHWFICQYFLAVSWFFLHVHHSGIKKKSKSGYILHCKITLMQKQSGPLQLQTPQSPEVVRKPEVKSHY